ncbi:hypothetical protein [Shewanella donghaensis]|uniref:hypothetical protein n=1 Tax=Shewanella donghaensis TaxID=238836 RepID=UPI001D0513B8|nr:hypothetical protein [Shewanella donghaensis]
MNKWILLTSLLVPIVLMSACSSQTAANAACDFVTGAHGNAKEREIAESRPENTSSVGSTRDDVKEGFFSAIFGSLDRKLNDDDECVQRQYFET